MTDFDTKLKEVFGELVIDKQLVRSLGIRNERTIPSFVEEWLVTRFAKPDADNEQIRRGILEFIKKHLPAKADKDLFLNRLHNGEQVTVLDSFKARVDLAKDCKYVNSPSLQQANIAVDQQTIDECPDLLSGGLWGAGRLHYSRDQKALMLIEFKPMQSGKVSLKHMAEARPQFTTAEWIDVIIRTMGLEPLAYNLQQKQRLVQRLIPLVQTNVNMMELAPKGTGKSFVFSNLSRYVWLNSGGALSQAQLFFNLNTKEIGLLGGRFDLLVLDEGQSIDFQGADSIHAKFKDYLESGKYTVGAHQTTSECGLMILANISLYDGRPERNDYIRELPEMFHDSALLDRFHGILPGWEIPRFQTDSVARGIGLKADVFGEYAHQLRHVSPTEFPYGNAPRLSGDSRDVRAVEKIAIALSKLYMLNPSDDDYEEYVLRPAYDLRARVRSQLAAVDGFEMGADLKVKVVG
ncbi:BREX system Lon protease-like protein BrxL [Noviherbaspirillum soli]|uniref:BREX system Lon protease-like protein BrxL n=1 Tax=Noviherbaspirillum soli TaxID=1064518 RepID=UPI00188CA152|nr:BREX system Lon protease-like protein BrxL [Noviherbaspirillum soli]